MLTNIKTAFTSPKGAKARLVATAIAALLGVISALSAAFSSEFSIKTILEFPFALATMVGILGLCAWSFVKWFNLMGKKPIGWAAKFWHSFLPLNLFTLFIKAYLWLVIIIVSYLIPTSIVGGLISAMVMGILSITATSSFLGVLALFAIGLGACAALYGLVKMDLRSIQTK